MPEPNPGKTQVILSPCRALAGDRSADSDNRFPAGEIGPSRDRWGCETFAPTGRGTGAVQLEDSMSRRLLTIGLTALLAGTAVIGVGSSAGAITFGEPDTLPHDNVGSLIGKIPDGRSFQWCTGTLISPTVFLTAAHCFADAEGVEFTVSFDDDLDVDPNNGQVGADVTRLEGEAEPHPLFASGGANDTYDIAVFVLAEEITDITPAPLPTSQSARRQGP